MQCQKGPGQDHAKKVFPLKPEELFPVPCKYKGSHYSRRYGGSVKGDHYGGGVGVAGKYGAC